MAIHPEEEVARYQVQNPVLTNTAYMINDASYSLHTMLAVRTPIMCLIAFARQSLPGMARIPLLQYSCDKLLSLLLATQTDSCRWISGSCL